MFETKLVDGNQKFRAVTHQLRASYSYLSTTILQRVSYNFDTSKGDDLVGTHF